MSDFFGLDSAIGWAHFRLRNGWKTPLIGAASYAALLAIVITVSVQADPRHRVMTLTNWHGIILGLQGAILILLGGSRINAAIRSDITLRLVESHRLMPLSPALAVSGYFWGPNLLPLLLAAVGFFAGAFVTAGAGLNLAAWFIANAVLLSFALFCWIVVALAASQSRAAGLLVFIALALLTVAAGPVLVIAPAAVLLNAPMLGQTIYDSSFDPSYRTNVLIASTFAQALIGIPLFIGVARKYRRPSEPALATIPALALLVFWVAASSYTISQVDLIRPRYMQINTNISLSASLLTSMLLAVLPISNTLRSATAHRAGPLIAMACAAVIAVLFCEADVTAKLFFPNVTQAGIVLLCYCLGICFLLRMLRGTRLMAGLTIIWLFLTWLGPVILDFVRYSGTDTDRSFEPTAIMGFSPVGSLVALFNDGRFDLRPGLIFQIALCVVIIVLSLTLRRSAKANGHPIGKALGDGPALQAPQPASPIA